MQCAARVLLCASACVAWASATYAQQLGLYEGDICKQEGSTLWTCTKPQVCATARQKWMKGIRPEICRSQGMVPIICCEPEVKPPPMRKSEQMCKKYGEAVFDSVPHFWTGKPEYIDTCVKVESLISSGNLARPREFPHMALIGYGEKDSIQWFCGGSLISERYVLTAAHCSRIQRRLAKWVRLGEYNVNSIADNTFDAYPMDFEIEERINHPDYNRGYNDIALYRLKTDVSLNEYMRPACLQTQHQFTKTSAIATGWGTTEGGNSSDVLLKVDLTFTPSKECNDLYQKSLDLIGGMKDESQICARNLKTGKGTCNTASGEPLQLRQEAPYCTFSIIGITSFGPKHCGDSSKPRVYTRVSHYVPWIESIVWP